MAHDVFISYSTADKSLALAICATLEQRRVRCWIAPRDITPGANWGAAIVEAIGSAKVFVLVFSDSANRSTQVSREVERAASRGLPIVPVRVENVVPSQALEYFLGSTHWLDAYSPPVESHVEKLADVVEAILGRHAGSQHGAANRSASGPGGESQRVGAAPSREAESARQRPSRTDSSQAAPGTRTWPLKAVVAYVIIPVVATFLTTRQAFSILTSGVVALVVSLVVVAMLLLPIGYASRRTITKGPLWATLVSGGLAAALLSLGAVLVVMELSELIDFGASTSGNTPGEKSATKTEPSSVLPALLLSLVLVAWPAWTVIFMKLCKDSHAAFVEGRFYQWLLRGSVLELLVAVPVHLYVRRKEDCSVGLASGAALVLGTLAAFIVIGPALLMWYVVRTQALQGTSLPPSAGPGGRSVVRHPAVIVTSVVVALGGVVTAFTTPDGRDSFFALLVWGMTSVAMLGLAAWASRGGATAKG